jgi:tape measure domain-containing protein
VADRDEVLLKIRAEGWKAAAKVVADTTREIERAKKAAAKKPPGGDRNTFLGRLGGQLKGLPAQWRAGNAGAAQFRRTIAGLGSDIGNVASGVGRLTAGAAGVGGIGLGALGGSQLFGGLGDNEAFQNARTSFKTFLGDAQKANAFVEELRSEVSNGSPFKLTDIFGNARQLLGFNLTGDQVIKTLDSVKSAALASGTGAAGFDRIVLSLGQIAAKGKLSAEEMLQLAEAGVPVQQIMRDTFKLTDKQMADIGNVNIPAPAALWAITEGPHGWDSRFAEAAENAKNDATNQRAQIAKNWEQFRRMLTEPLFKELNENVYPEVRDALGNAVRTFERDDLSFDAKAELAWKNLRRDLGPLWEEVERGFEGLEVGDKLEWAAARGIDLAVDAVVAAAPKLASAFWDSFKDMSTTGKVLTVAFLWNRFRLPFWSVGGKLAGALGGGLWSAGKWALTPAATRLGQTAGAQAAKSAAETAALRSMTMGDAIRGKAGPGMRLAGGGLGAILGAALAAKTLDEITKRITGDSLSERLREGVTGRDKDGRRTMPGTGSFGASPDVRTPDATRLAELEAWFRDAEKRPGGGWVGTRNVPGLGPARRNLSQTDRDELNELRKRLRPRATGGTVRPGEFTIVGERGPEMARYPSGTQVTSNRDARLQASGARGRKVIERVIRETPTVVMLDGKVLYESVRRQTELVELRG